MQYDDLKQRFTTYVQGFKKGKKPYLIYRKEVHTQAVLDNTIKLCSLLNWNEEDTILAKTIALLHDIGRFPQAEKYGTFRDDLSEDHAEMGVRIIEEEQLLKGLTPTQQTIIKEAIKWHNKSESMLPTTIEKDVRRYLETIRDADKIDIIKIVQETTKKENQQELAKASSYTLEETMNEHIQQLVLRDKDIDKAEVTTVLENKAFILNWIHRFYHKESILILKEQGCYEEMLNSIPEDYSKIREHLRTIYKRNIISAS